MLNALLGFALTIGTAQAGSLRYAEDHAPAIVNPLFSTTMSEARLNELVFEGLFSDDRELRSAPRLAQRIELAEDKLSATLWLKDGLHWHDGKPVVPDDVVFTINAMKNRYTASTEGARVTWIDKVEKVDENSVIMYFTGPEVAPQDKLHFKILPAHRFDGTTVKRSDPFRTKPIGTGPWVMMSFNDDNSVSLQQNSFSPSSPKISEVVMREVSDKNYQAKLLIYQSLEALVRVLPRDLAALQNDRRIELYPYQTNSWWYVGFNQKDARLKYVRVRRAISLMTDVPNLLAPIGTGDTLTGPFVRSSPYYNHKVSAWPHAPDAAADLLVEAGYTFNGRHWMGSDGKELSIRIATLQNLETAQDVVINMQSQLQNRGITVEVDFLTIAEWKERVWRRKDFDLVLSQWSFDRNEDVYEHFHSKGARNFVGYSNENVDKLLEDARLADDPQLKKNLLREVHAIVHNDLPMRFLWTLDSYSALSVKVKNVEIHPFYFFTWTPDWSVE
ncbi:MAG: hypothetical protein GWP91_25115 [Rhodobacterales bacterium]|nr:hypothetical protein [Rhodobacterales bacterium]